MIDPARYFIRVILFIGFIYLNAFAEADLQDSNPTLCAMLISEMTTASLGSSVEDENKYSQFLYTNAQRLKNCSPRTINNKLKNHFIRKQEIRFWDKYLNQTVMRNCSRNKNNKQDSFAICKKAIADVQASIYKMDLIDTSDKNDGAFEKQIIEKKQKLYFCGQSDHRRIMSFDAIKDNDSMFFCDENAVMVEYSLEAGHDNYLFNKAQEYCVDSKDTSMCVSKEGGLFQPKDKKYRTSQGDKSAPGGSLQDLVDGIKKLIPSRSRAK